MPKGATWEDHMNFGLWFVFNIVTEEYGKLGNPLIFIRPMYDLAFHVACNLDDTP